MAVVPSLGVRVTVAESLIRDLGRASEWCDLWGVKLNASKQDYESLEVSNNASPVTPIECDILIVDPWQSCVCFIRSGVTRCTFLIMVIYLDRMCQCGLHAVLWSHIGTLTPPRCRTLQSSRTFIPFSVSLWNDLANPVFDCVGLAGFKSSANASLLA